MMKIANSMYCVAMGLCLRQADGDAKVAIEAVIASPGPDTVRAVLRASMGQPWRPTVEGALIEIGIAASAGLECSK